MWNYTAVFCLVSIVIAGPAQPRVWAQSAAVAAGQPPLSLSDCISLTLTNNPSALAAAQQVDQAEAEVRQAESGQKFQLSFNSTGGVSNAAVIQPPPAEETFGAIQNSLTVPVNIGPRPVLAIRQAKEQLLLAQDNFRSAALVIAAKVSSAYFDLLTRRALAVAAAGDLSSAQREQSEAQSRNDAGDIPALELLQAQAPVASAEAALLEAQTAEAIALETLNDLLDRPLDEPLQVVDVAAEENAPEYTVDEARTQAVASSPDVAAADAAIEAGEAALAAAKHFADPALSIQAVDLRSGDQTSFSREDTLQASVTVPIDDGGLGRASVEYASNALMLAEDNLAAAKKLAAATVSSAYLTVEGSIAEVAAATAAQDIAETTYQKALIAYSNGLFPLVDVLAAQTEVAQAKTTYIEALYDAAGARSILDMTVNGITANIPADMGSH